jgi:hypothetical protein
MAVKTWTSERVYSSDINTYLTNSGLVWVKEQSVTSSVASVTVSSAFSSSYDGYRIIVEHTATGSGGLNMALGTATSNTTGWYGAHPYWAYNATGDGVVRWVNIGWGEIGFTSTSPGFSVVDIWYPYGTTTKYVTATQTSRINYTGTPTSTFTNTTSFTAFTLWSSVGNLTAAKIYVYGYRKS